MHTHSPSIPLSISPSLDTSFTHSLSLVFFLTLIPGLKTDTHICVYTYAAPVPRTDGLSHSCVLGEHIGEHRNDDSGDTHNFKHAHPHAYMPVRASYISGTPGNISSCKPCSAALDAYCPERSSSAAGVPCPAGYFCAGGSEDKKACPVPAGSPKGSDGIMMVWSPQTTGNQSSRVGFVLDSNDTLDDSGWEEDSHCGAHCLEGYTLLRSTHRLSQRFKCCSLQAFYGWYATYALLWLYMGLAFFSLRRYLVYTKQSRCACGMGWTTPCRHHTVAAMLYEVLLQNSDRDVELAVRRTQRCNDAMAMLACPSCLRDSGLLCEAPEWSERVVRQRRMGQLFMLIPALIILALICGWDYLFLDGFHFFSWTSELTTRHFQVEKEDDPFLDSGQVFMWFRVLVAPLVPVCIFVVMQMPRVILCQMQQPPNCCVCAG